MIKVHRYQDYRGTGWYVAKYFGWVSTGDSAEEAAEKIRARLGDGGGKMGALYYVGRRANGS